MTTTNGLTTETMNEFMQLVTMANTEQLVAMRKHIDIQLLVRGEQ